MFEASESSASPIAVEQRDVAALIGRQRGGLGEEVDTGVADSGEGHLHEQVVTAPSARRSSRATADAERRETRVDHVLISLARQTL